MLRDVLRLLAPIVPFATDRIWREVYGGSVHGELFPHARDVNEDLRDLTAKVIEFNSHVWKEKKDRKLSLKDPLDGLAVPDELDHLAEALVRMHHLAP
ncbi:MAG: hypothetical protein AUI33_02635 [Ignavibacteria bacterium 13_1_40CM_2_61_4]|nr:MAG: hypothetical protein AUI33_02635 [Ignavibacteria bacterium 13_1_40CM_2_61_4]